ncbi:MAG: response regulator [Deltaproteobacteria bacterium]|nr:response regulator [Deltaproteobacteria bacterium]MBW2341291.1 response regulator [Deltaproteobacteria bacterium]
MTDLGKLLIVDADETFLNSTADLLRRGGYQCDCATDLKAAARMLTKGEYHLLITESRMPGNLNLEFIKNLPRIVEGIPVILVTGYPSLNSAIESIRLPVVAYMVKPIEFDQLYAQVKVAINSFRVYRSSERLRQRLKDWNRDLVSTEDALRVTKVHEFSLSLDNFLKLTLANITGALLDINHLVESIPGTKSEREICHLFNCPRLRELTDALVETTGILEKSKSAFKSKELGELRRKLEALVKGETG